MWYGKGELRLKIEWMMPITELNIRRVSMVQYNQKVLFKWKEAEEESERCGDGVETERCFAAGFEDEAGDGSQGMQMAFRRRERVDMNSFQ